MEGSRLNLKTLQNGSLVRQYFCLLTFSAGARDASAFFLAALDTRSLLLCNYCSGAEPKGLDPIGPDQLHTALYGRGIGNTSNIQLTGSPAPKQPQICRVIRPTKRPRIALAPGRSL